MGIWTYSADSGYQEYQNVIRQDGSTGVLVAMDVAAHANAGDQMFHSALQFFIKGQPFPNKVTIFNPGPGQACCFPQISRKSDNTLVATFDYVPSGFDSATWSIGRTFWQIGECISNDGGLTWGPVIPVTSDVGTFGYCCPQVARFIGSNNYIQITYGSSHHWSNLSDTVDLQWADISTSAVKTYNWYLGGVTLNGVEEQKSEGQKIPDYELGPVAPNPLRGACRIAYQLPKPGHTSLAVYNSLGQRVRALVDRFEPVGRFTVIWDGRDDCGKPVGAGIYFVRFAVENVNTTRRITVLR